MKSHFAYLLALRNRSVASNPSLNADRKMLIEAIFPTIMAQCNKGFYSHTFIIPISDAIEHELRQLGYVVERLDRDSPGARVSWGLQTIHYPDGRTQRVSAANYNIWLAGEVEKQKEGQENNSDLELPFGPEMKEKKLCDIPLDYRYEG